MPEPHLRAADTDRTAVAEVLGAHMSAGRLTVSEYDERLSRAYAAKTYGELAELTADLPSLTPAKPTSSSPVPAQRSHHGGACGPAAWPGTDRSYAWRSWLTTSLIVVTIWAATSLAAWEFNYFWPIWVIAPWGAVLLAQTITGRGHDHRSDRHPERRRA